MPETTDSFTAWWRDPEVQAEVTAIRQLTGATAAEAALILQQARLCAVLLTEDDDPERPW